MSKIDKTAPFAFAVLTALAGVVAAATFGAETAKSSRTWKTTDGETTEATLIKVFNDRENDDAKSVALRLADGMIVLVPLSALSTPDRDFVAAFESGKKLSGGSNAPKRSFFNPLGGRDVVVETEPGRKSAGRPEKYALLIGVNKYENFSPFAQLQYCAKDMKLLAKTLTKNGFPPENVFTMTTDENDESLKPTKENIEYQIDALSRLVGPDDAIFIAFSGHGVAFGDVSYLCPTETPELRADADPSDFARKLVSRSWVFEQAKAARAKNRILLFDACRNDPFEAEKKKALETGERSATLGRIGQIRTLSQAEASGASFYMMAGCEYGKFSMEPPELKNGLFTYFLAQGLSGYADVDRTTGNADGKVSVKEAFEYANFRVRNYRNPNGYVQRPLDFRSDMDYAPELTVVPDDLPPLPEEVASTEELNRKIAARLEAAQTAFDAENYVTASAEVAAALALDSSNEEAAALKTKIDAAQRAADEKRRAEQAETERKRREAEAGLTAAETERKKLKTINAALTKASDYFSAHNYDLAESELKNVRELDPNNAMAKFIQSQIDAARKPQTAPEDEEIATLSDNSLKNAAAMDKMLAGRQREIEKILETEPNNLEATERLAKIAEKRAKLAVETARLMRRQFANFGDGSVAGELKRLYLTDGVEYPFRWCPAGRWQKENSDSAEERDGASQVAQTSTKGFWLLETEVTQEMWASVMGEYPSYFSLTGGGRSLVSGMNTEQFPVDSVSWEDCQEFVAKLQRFAPSGWRFTLPTKYEWEYACRAGSSGKYGGNGVLDDMGWYKENSGNRTHRVGEKESNAWGLRDMRGNVAEWCPNIIFPNDADLEDLTAQNDGSERNRGKGRGIFFSTFTGFTGNLVAVAAGASYYKAQIQVCENRIRSARGGNFDSAAEDCDSISSASDISLRGVGLRLALIKFDPANMTEGERQELEERSEKLETLINLIKVSKRAQELLDPHEKLLDNSAKDAVPKFSGNG